jgi:Methane oxygenase PmoA
MLRRAAFFGFVLLLAPGAGPSLAARKTPRALGRVVVEAGAFARRATPVRVALPPAFAQKRLVLLDGKAKWPLDVDAAGTGVFVLHALAPGKKLDLSLEEAPASPEAAVAEKTADAVVVRLGSREIFRYVTVGRAPRADVPPRSVRAGYIHPLLTPSGVPVTDDYHPKHRGHHGIWTAWTAAEFEGRKLSFWSAETGKNEFIGLDKVFSGAVTAGFTARHRTSDLTQTPAKPVLAERWQVVVYRTHENDPPYFLFDLEWTDEVVGTAPLRLPQYRYGGLGLRGSGAWDGPGNLAVLTSEGKDRVAGEGSTGRWIHLGGVVSGKAAGFAVLGHPQNFRAPQPFRVHPNEPFVSIAPAKAGDFSIEPGKPYVSRYRFVSADGPADRALYDRLWNDFAHPPHARFQAAN